jgi:hypothetical protein
MMPPYLKYQQSAVVGASREAHIVLSAALYKAFVYRWPTKPTSVNEQQGTMRYLRNLETREADQRADSSLVKEFHRRK